ncbi:Alpha/Beta hydrolase protein [Hypoxylon sp. FL1284]|nr:Alpha/Beta hydrolase protein [Hypoxylon sp. FL1284]
MLEDHPAPGSEQRKGVLIIPGGRYGYVGVNQDGKKPKQWLHERGFHVWVLIYTCADNHLPSYPKPMDEAKTAVEDIRRTDRVDKLGIWGWSAGGHLAAITATEFESGLDFMILSYPVISMEGDITHIPSRQNLLGNEPPLHLVQQLSAETRVSETTPTTFIFHTAEDEQVLVENSLRLSRALNRYHRPFWIHVQAEGQHGIGMGDWTIFLDCWLQDIMSDQLLSRELDESELKLSAQRLSVKNSETSR